MCTDCGCAISKHSQHLDLAHSLLHENQQQANANRHLFRRHDITVVNLMSSPGSGKTELLKQTLQQLSHLHCAVIVGDLQTDNDAKRLQQPHVPVIQITTGNACHLDAAMIARACRQLPLEKLDLIFIENVGNLVCPADFDLGQSASVVLLSVTEGDDKPCKYPAMFRAADLVIQSKSDLLPHMRDFDSQRLKSHLQQIGVTAPLLSLSAYEDLSAFCQWLEELKKEPVAR